MSFDLGALLADVVDDLDREQIEYISIDSIDADALNFYEMSGIEDLAANIELIGLQQPIRVRPSDDVPGRYVVVSGHRRMAAIRQLVADESCKRSFSTVPCIVELDDVSASMRELRLIYANASTRVLTSPEIAKQAERVEALLYQLKEEGVEFPGRMRDHVAEACRVSKTKLARLKVIRDNLTEGFRGQFDEGKLSEQAAYALARLPADHQQEYFAALKPDHVVPGNVAEKILAFDATVHAARACHRGCETCDNLGRIIKKNVNATYDWNVCRGSDCCMECCERYSCSGVCDVYCAEKAAAKKEEAKRSEERKAEAEKHAAKCRDISMASGKRLLALIDKYGYTGSLHYGYYNECNRKQIESAIEKISDRDNLSADAFEYISAPKAVADAAAIGCTVDELLGVASAEPAQPAAWQKGRPTKTGHYVARFTCDGTELMKLAYFDAISEKFYFSENGKTAIDAECVAWYPVPEVE